MGKKIKGLSIKRILSLTMSLLLILNLVGPNYFAQRVSAAVVENPNRELTVSDIPDTKLFNKLKELADTNKDGKLIIVELANYKGDSTGKLNLSNLDITNINGLGYAKGVKAIDLSGNNSLNSVADRIFLDCKELVSIILPESITSLGSSAFEGCISLKDINLPKGLTDIGEKCFFQCTNLTGIVLPVKITNIGDSAFSGSGLKAIEISNPKVNIGISVFDGCKDLDDAKLPEGITTIPMGSFKASGLSNINIPKSIQVIEEGAFSDSAIKSIDLSMCTNLTSIKTAAFSGTLINDIKLPESLTELGSRVFENCVNLSQVKIPSKITVINELTFSQCLSLEKLIFTPDASNNYNMQEIKSLAFNKCINLGGKEGNVDFLKDLNKLSIIGDKAFAYCSVDTKEKDEYNQSIYNGIKSVTLPKNIIQLGKGVFSYCSTLESIIIPNKVTIIEDEAFKACYNLKNVTLSNQLTSIGNSSFESCKVLENIVFPNSLKKIGSNAFANCADERLKNNLETKKSEYVYAGIENLVFPDNLTEIGDGAFSGCFNLATVKLPANLTELGNGIFQDSARQLKDENGILINDSYIGLKSVKFPEKLNSIGNSTFKNAYNFNLVDGKLPDTLSKIGSSTFENCKSLTSIVIPYSLNIIGASLFLNCNGLKTVDFQYAANLSQIGQSAFKNTSIEGIVRLPNKLDKVENSVFEGCRNITSVEFPDGLISIGSSSFKGCESLLSITIPAAATINSSENTASFSGCKLFSNAIVKAVPKDITVMENSDVILPINCFNEIKPLGIQSGNENIATAQLNQSNTSKPQVSLKGIKEGQTTITIKGTIEYSAGKDPLTGNNLVNRFDSQVQFNVIVSAKKCTDITVEQSVRGLNIDKTAGITLNPSITPSDTTDLKKWSSDNPLVATVSDNGVVKPVAYGTAIITLTVGEKEAKYTINVCAPANKITLDKSNSTLVIGDKLPITATLDYSSKYSDIKTQYPDVVVWSTSDSKVATVDQSGNVIAVGAGEAVITAKADGGGVTKTCKITVIPEVTDVSFDKSNVTLVKGDLNEVSQTITMTLNPKDSPLSAIKVTSSNTLIASVSVKDNIITVTAKRGGYATITATPINGKSASCTVEVKSPITSITAKPMDLNKGASRTLALTVTPSDTTDKIAYSSSNPAVATVDETGKVTGISAGAAVINIKAENGVVANCLVSVKVPVKGVSFSTTSTKLMKNEKRELAPILVIQPSDATNKDVTWSSNNTNVAVVDKDGVVTAVGIGRATITVNTADGSYKATYTVEVTLPIINDKSIDVNNDGKIDLLDVSRVATGYNSISGGSLYNTKHDFNLDNIIDIYDLVIVSKYIY